jgi:hypothetical protein
VLSGNPGECVRVRHRRDCYNVIRVLDFVVRQAQTISLSGAKTAITALRSFLRLLQQRGLLRTDLSAAVPGVAGWRLTHLPKTLNPARYLLG